MVSAFKLIQTLVHKWHVHLKITPDYTKLQPVCCLSELDHLPYFLFHISRVPGNGKQTEYQWKHRQVYKGRCQLKKRGDKQKRTLEGRGDKRLMFKGQREIFSR